MEGLYPKRSEDVWSAENVRVFLESHKKHQEEIWVFGSYAVALFFEECVRPSGESQRAELSSEARQAILSQEPLVPYWADDTSPDNIALCLARLSADSKTYTCGIWVADLTPGGKITAIQEGFKEDQINLLFRQSKELQQLGVYSTESELAAQMDPNAIS